MTGIDDLRRTLDHHADEVVDHQLGERSTSVHQLIGVRRNRRRAAVAGGAALTLAAIGGVALLPDPTTPQPATVVGLEAPAQLTSLGFTYEFERSVDGSADGARMELPASDRPRLVTWATSGADDSVTLTQRVAPGPIEIESADFGDFLVIGAGNDDRIRAQVDEGRVGLAVYELVGELPPGVASDGVVFRDEYAGQPLLGAAFGDPGETEIEVEATSQGDQVGYATYCTGAPEGAVLNLGQPGSPIQIGSCGDPFTIDASRTTTTFRSSPGKDETAQMWLTDGFDGPTLTDAGDEVRIGFGIYQESPNVEKVGVGRLQAEVEYDGHLWELHSVARNEPGSGVVSATPPAGVGPVLAVDVLAPGVGARFSKDFVSPNGATRGSGLTGIGSGASTGMERLGAGSELTIRMVRGEPSAATKLAVGIYVQAD